MLLVLSGTLMATTLFPHIDVGWLFIGLTIALAAGGLVITVVLRIVGRRSGRVVRVSTPAMGRLEKMSWRMPPLALLKPVKWSPGIRLGILSLRAYLVLSAALLLVKAIQLGGG
jgi:hypothetical protein